MIRRGSKSFAGAARLLEPDVRDSVYLLYAWCRWCDDRIDSQDAGRGAPGASPELMRERLEELTRLTDATLAGDPPAEIVFTALQRVVERHGIPHEHPRALLRGFAMDAEGRRYSTLDDVLDYCYHVAGVVGVMMAHVMGAHRSEALDRAADLGIALQMTNIARDVIDDAAAGRDYLPLDWIEAEGIPPAAIREDRYRAPLVRIVRRFLEEADPYYTSASFGLRYLSLRSASALGVKLVDMALDQSWVGADGSLLGFGQSLVSLEDLDVLLDLCRILHRGLTVGHDEADLVAVDPDGRTLVIVEVKTRAADVPGPEAGLTRDKQFRLARLASRLQERSPFRGHPIRIDAVAIVWPPDGDPDIRHYEDALESPW